METFPDSEPVPGDEEGLHDVAGSAVRQLKRVWQAEKAAPEILPCAVALLEQTQKDIQDAESRLEEVGASPHTPTSVLQVQMLTMDLDRAKFVVRSYLRCRVAKIDKLFLHIFGDGDLFDRLSEAEQEYCERAIKQSQRHMEQAVLNRMPPKYDNMLKQSENSADPDMIPQAELDVFVFCKATRLLEDVQLDPSAEDSITLHPRELHILHYRPIRSLVLDGSILLL